MVAGSTLEGEETMLRRHVLRVAADYPRALLVLAPRHPQRFAPWLRLLARRKCPFATALAVGWRRVIAGRRVFLLDTIGELASLYQFADIAFMGGSLVPRGGHNVLEAAQFGVPILVGPTPRISATSSIFSAEPMR